MRRIGLGIILALTGLANSGCHSCGDRPRLFERLFNRDDSPSYSRFSQGRDTTDRRPCDTVLASNTATAPISTFLGAPSQPVSYGNPCATCTTLPSNPPIMTYPPSDSFPSSGNTGPSRNDELPQPGGYQRIPPPSVPEASPAPAIPNVMLYVPNQQGRVTADPKK